MDEYKEHYCKLTNTVATDRIKFQIKNPPLPSSSQIVEMGRSTPWNLYCTSLAPWHERLNNSFLQLLQLWRATYISNIDENIIIEKRQLTFPILNLFFVHCSNDYTPLPLVAEHQDYSVHRSLAIPSAPTAPLSPERAF